MECEAASALAKPLARAGTHHLTNGRNAWLTPEVSSNTMVSDSPKAITITSIAIGRRAKRWLR